MKTKLISTRFGTFGTFRFDQKSFFNSLISFTSWDYKPTYVPHADSPGVYTSEKIINLSTIDKIHLKCDATDGSVVNDSRQLFYPVSFWTNHLGIKDFVNLKQYIIKI